MFLPSQFRGNASTSASAKAAAATADAQAAAAEAAVRRATATATEWSTGKWGTAPENPLPLPCTGTEWTVERRHKPGRGRGKEQPRQLGGNSVGHRGRSFRRMAGKRTKELVTW